MRAAIETQDQLRDLVRDLLAEIDDPDIDVVVDKLGAELRPEEILAVARPLLRHVVAEVVRNQGLRVRQQPSARQGRKSSPDLVREWWAEFLTTRTKVGDSWKFNGDLTVDDIEAAAAERYRLAAANTAEAERWMRLADLLASSPCATVRELSPVAVRSALEGAS